MPHGPSPHERLVSSAAKRELADLLGAVDSVDPRPTDDPRRRRGRHRQDPARARGRPTVSRARHGRRPALRRGSWRVAHACAWQKASCRSRRSSRSSTPFTPDRDLVQRLRTRLAGGGDAHRTPPGSAEARRCASWRSATSWSRPRADSRFLVVLDDLHWADQSTLDLVLFLARRLRGHSVVLLGAYRSDELHRRHPLRPVVAELSRGYVRERIELGPLDHRGGRRSRFAQLRDVARRRRARGDRRPGRWQPLLCRGARRARVRSRAAARIGPGRPACSSRRARCRDAARVLGACAVVGRRCGSPSCSSRSSTWTRRRWSASHRDWRSITRSWYRSPAAGTASVTRSSRKRSRRPAPERPRRAASPNRRRHFVSCLRSRAPSCCTWRARPTPRPQRRSGGGGRCLSRGSAIAFRALAWAEGVAAFERAAELAATAGSDTDASCIGDCRTS